MALARRLHAYLHQSRSPVDLAVARVVVFGLLAYHCVGQSPVWMAGLPTDLLHAPPLTGWLVALLDPSLVRIAQVVTIACALAAALGLGYPVSAWIAVLGALYVLGVPQLWGKVNHYHHVLWFAAILAASPAADALTLSRRPIPASSRAYGQPLAFLGLLLGVCYFIPGIAKLGTPGWIWSDNLKYQLYQKWAEIPDFTPLFALDQYPLALRLLALATVLFEVSFLWLILFPRLRPFAVVGGLGFHAGSALFMGINFWPLWLCYVVFIRWPVASSTIPAPPPRPSVAALGWAITFAAIMAYPLRHDSWPIGYYPTFAFIAGPTRQMVRVEGLNPAVERRLADRLEPSRWNAILTRAAAHPDPAVRDRTRRGITLLVQREAPQSVPRLTVGQREAGPRR